jgi:hypothetical protein
MQARRNLILANLACLLVLAVALVIGWRMEALFGLGVLIVMDLLALLRERTVRSRRDENE